MQVPNILTGIQAFLQVYFALKRKTMCGYMHMYLVIIVCLSGLISSKIFLISGSNPISSIRSASSSTFNIKDIICDLNIQLGVKTETVKSAVY